MAKTKNNQSRQFADDTRSTDIRDSAMMAHLLDALQEGQDVGHYGRLVFTMIARWFMEDNQIARLLAKQPGMDENQAQAMVLEVKARDYNPPKREKILQWQSQQDFQICPDEEDPNGCNVYKELKFPDEVYNRIGDFWEERVEAGDAER
jgi:hypothetical protein